MANNHHHHNGACGCSSQDSTKTVDTSEAAQSLRTRQAPIKQSYKDDPSAALVTLSSTGTLSNTSIACKIGTGAAAQKIAGLHPKAGGPDPDLSGELCSGDMLLDALVACAGVTLKAVATALGLPLKDGTVRAEGDLDFRGTLGVDREAPVGFKEIRLSMDLEFEDGADVGAESIEKLGKLTERYCVVLQTITRKPEVKVRVAGKVESEDGVEKTEVWGMKI